jgi:starch phosphorylase
MESNHHDKECIAYFSMEIGISHKMPTYAGGLGILAGDLLKSFADLNVNALGITLLNEKGYFYQKINVQGNQIEQPVAWSVSDFMVLLPNIIIVNIAGREVKVRVWKHLVRGVNGNTLPVFFLDTNIDGNSDYDRNITSYLYGGDREYRLSQEIVLGIGGVRMLESLGYKVRKYHMNEGHAALLTVELLKKTFHEVGNEEKNYNIISVKDKCVFTTHTPVAAGHDRFDIGLFRKLLGDYVPDFVIRKASENNQVSMTLLGLNMSMYVNGVAKRHGEIAREMFPEYRIDSITNGIHPLTWVSLPLKSLFDEFIPGWIVDPFTLRYALSIPKDRIWDAHTESKKILIDEINQRANIGFHTARFTIGYARRFTEYKRPELILFDIQRLRQIADRVGDIQVVFAGKAHSQDTNGKDIIRNIVRLANEINSQNCKLKIAFLEQYDMLLARKMVAGCDVWLNTPQRPYEASGTSGMKAALNGVPQLSTLDGWWLEGHIENTTGWSIGPHPHDPGFTTDTDMTDEAVDLYNKLEQIVPMFYANRDKWTEIMRHCIAINGSFFNTFRMAQQYIANAYSD